MKKSGILNSQLAGIIASMGHTDKLVICDCGLPIPRNAELVDLALCEKIPGFLETLSIILQELKVEGAVIAEELLQSSNGTFEEIKKMLPGIDIKKTSHDNFKQLCRNGDRVSFVRTGETTPYANIILHAGVIF